MKKLLKGLAYLFCPVIAVIVVSKLANGWWAFLAFLLVLIIEGIILRGPVLMFIGQCCYPHDHLIGLKWMKASMKTGRNTPSGQLLYAYLLLRNGYVDEAETIINKATYLGKDRLKPNDFKTAEFNKAIITWKRGDLNSAIMQMEELFNEGYVNSNIYGTLGYFYIANNELEKAIEFATEAIEYNEDDRVSLDNLGQAYIAMGNLDEAEEAYKKAFEKSADFIEVHYNYATLLEKRGELSEAREYYEKALGSEEKFLSTVTHDMVKEAIARVDGFLSIGIQDMERDAQAFAEENQGVNEEVLEVNEEILEVNEEILETDAEEQE